MLLVHPVTVRGHVHLLQLVVLIQVVEEVVVVVVNFRVKLLQLGVLFHLVQIINHAKELN